MTRFCTLLLATTVLLPACVDEQTPARVPAHLEVGDEPVVDAGIDVDADRHSSDDPELAPLNETQVELDGLLDTIERETGRSLPEAFASTSVENIQRVASLVHSSMSAEQRERWTGELQASIAAEHGAKALPPTSEQIAALEQFAAASVADLHVVWDFESGSPSRVDEIGYMYRRGDASATWSAFLAEKSGELSSLFGDSILTDTEIVDVTAGRGPFDIVRVLRRREGLRIDQDHVDVYVTNERSPLGAGTLWKIVGRWNVRVPEAFARLRATGILTEAAVRGSFDGDMLAATLHIGCSDVCQATWSLLKDFSEEILVDAISGNVIGGLNPRNNYTGTVRQLGVPAWSNGATASIRMRGAEIRRTSWPAGHAGATSMSDGTYNLSATSPWSIDLCGAQSSSGAWPDGRVERRVLGNPNAIVNVPVAWNPSSNPNPNFGAPDSWPSTSDLRHGQEIMYGWYAYWQDLFRLQVGVQVPDTFKFQLAPEPVGFSGGNTGSYDSGVPGSGQATHADTMIGWPMNDSFPTTPSAANSALFLVAHEYAHGVQGCSANAGGGCSLTDPGTQSFRPTNPSDWRRVVYDAFVENGANAIAVILSGFRTTGDEPNLWKHDWRYGGYLDTTDDFANPIEDSFGGYNCNDPSTPNCPATHSCQQTEESGWQSPQLGGAICRRICAASPDCVSPPWPEETQFCTNFVLGSGFCQQFGYTNNWFTTVGTRLAFDLGWADALYLMMVAMSGANNNGLRDFNIGSDTWYDQLADLNYRTLGVTRAVRSVTNESGVTSRDDYADSLDEALAVPVRNTSGTSILWGASSPGAYPSLSSSGDVDWFLFRGNAASSYTATATPRAGSSADLALEIRDLNTSGAAYLLQGSNPAGPTAVLTTGALPTTGWYAIRVGNRVLSSGEYTLRIQIASTASDDFPNIASEAYPVPSGVPQAGYLNPSDVDRFQIYGRIVSPSALTVVATGTPTPTVHVYAPNNTLLGTAVGTVTIPGATIASYGTGHYSFTITNPGSTSYAYSVTATFACTSWSAASCDNLSTAPTIDSRYTWGDRFAGRLPVSTATATYSVTLNANESASFSLTDASSTCQYELELIPPTGLDLFRSQVGSIRPVSHWTDDSASGLGPGASDTAGTRRGAGGHIFAPMAGRYSVLVRSRAGSSCTYRMYIAKAGHVTTAMPEW